MNFAKMAPDRAPFLRKAKSLFSIILLGIEAYNLNFESRKTVWFMSCINIDHDSL